MEVKTKNEDRGMSFLGSVIMIFIFLILPVIILTVFSNVFAQLYQENETEVFISLIPIFIIFAFFFVIGVILFYYLVKKPKKYKAKLMYKKAETYKDKNITYLGFVVYDQKLKKHGKFNEERKNIGTADFWCYVTEQNNLQEERDYIVSIKEFNWTIKKIEEYIGESYGV